MKIAIIGAGIIGVTTAICFLKEKYDVTVYTKDEPLQTNSDAAVAVWYAPNDARPLLQKLCFDSLDPFFNLTLNPNSGVQLIPIVYYFKNQQEFSEHALSKKPCEKMITANPKNKDDIIDHPDYKHVVVASVPIADVNIYRPFLLNEFEQLGGKIKREHIFAISELINKGYDIIVNCTGWESKFLTSDSSIHPVRGQIEIGNIRHKKGERLSVNIPNENTYLIFRPTSDDFVIGGTHQIDETSLAPKSSDKISLIRKILPFFPEVKNIKTTSRVGIRCGRDEVRLEKETIINKKGKKVVLFHCYGHGGSGYSASWGSAHRIINNT